MNKGCLGMVAAMPEEIGPLLRRVPGYRKEKGAGWVLYRFTLGEVPVVLIESGMGPRKAAAATERLISLAAPEAIVNFGFGGGVRTGIEVGDLVVADRVLLLAEGELTEAPLPDRQLSEMLQDACRFAGITVRAGTFVTAAAIMNKKEVAGLLGDTVPIPVLEMETAAILSTARQAGIPVVAVRGISDAADEELGFSLEEFCDGELNLSLPRILGCVIRRPWIIPQLIKLAGNSRKAGNNLAACVELLGRALTL